MNDALEKLRIAESGILEKEYIQTRGRTIQDFSGFNWWMEHMRPGQGVAEGIPYLNNELAGNDFSWNNAHVPGDVYTDLEYAGELDDLHFGRNMAKAKWVQNLEWWYNYSFNLSDDMVGKRLTLLFEGVDYSCDVWLNTKHLGHHEGMMESFRFDITDVVDFKFDHVPTNLLNVKLDPPPKNQKNFAGMKHNFSGDYLTGLIPFGIWKPIKLLVTGDARIDDYRLETKLVGGRADISVDVGVMGLRSEGITSAKVGVVLKDKDGNRFETETIAPLSAEYNQVPLTLSIEEPKLWWPYELGEPHRYEIQVYVMEGEDFLDEVVEKVGLREITMERNPGFTEEEAEFPWTFVVNGKKMFLRSACWGGQPSFFYGRNNREKYRYYLKKARECNINNLRMFGWHPPEAEDFYDICDELGITVWTNFSFATQVFREDEEYLTKLYHQIGEIVKDRRNHPSTIMWMGGEEIFFSKAHINSGNARLMKKLGDITRGLTNVPYADGSPLSTTEAVSMGYKPKESYHANSHYYAPGLIFMEEYYPILDFCIIPELTAASSPSIDSLRKFIPEDELWPMGPSWGYHAGDIHTLQILNYEVFGDNCMDSVEHFAEATQIAQGTIFQFALEHFRRQKPHVSGVALCHFLTNWPMIKWDLVDYYGEVKKSYDFVKASYQPLLPSLEFSKRRWMPGELFKANTWIVNDYHKPYDDITYTMEIFDDQGNLQYLCDELIDVNENSSVKCREISWVVTGEEDTYFNVKLALLDKEKNILAENDYTILIADQVKAKQVAAKMNTEMNVERDKYGRGYYRYSKEVIEKIRG